jgi:hypothetical protein
VFYLVVWGKICAFFHKIKEDISMDTMTLLLVFLVTVAVFAAMFLWLYRRWTHPMVVSPFQQMPQKEPSAPQVSSDSRAFNSPEEWQRSGKNFASSPLPSQMPLDYRNTKHSKPGLSPSTSPSKSRHAEEKPQITTSGNRSVEHYMQHIHVFYEPRIDGISLVFTDTVITNAIEVDNVFTVCERKFKEVMKARGWERVGWIADLGGYNLVGIEATTLVGETLKLFLDKFGLKTKGGFYLIAHYSSKAASPDQETLNEKLKRIQFITAGVINEFQGNVFDTQEEAIAFYMRLRQEFRAGR